MTVIIGLALFIGGALIGFVLNKFTGSASQESKELANKVTQSEIALEEYKANVADHLDSSAKLLEKMHATCEDAMTQMAESTKLLHQATPDETSSMPFFSQETQEQLAETVQLRKSTSASKKDIAITEAPLDYSGNPSGLFEDKKQPVTNTEQANKELS